MVALERRADTGDAARETLRPAVRIERRRERQAQPTARRELVDEVAVGAAVTVLRGWRAPVAVVLVGRRGESEAELGASDSVAELGALARVESRVCDTADCGGTVYVSPPVTGPVAHGFQAFAAGLFTLFAGCPRVCAACRARE